MIILYAGTCIVYPPRWLSPAEAQWVAEVMG